VTTPVTTRSSVTAYLLCSMRVEPRGFEPLTPTLPEALSPVWLTWHNADLAKHVGSNHEAPRLPLTSPVAWHGSGTRAVVDTREGLGWQRIRNGDPLTVGLRPVAGQTPPPGQSHSLITTRILHGTASARTLRRVSVQPRRVASIRCGVALSRRTHDKPDLHPRGPKVPTARDVGLPESRVMQ